MDIISFRNLLQLTSPKFLEHKFRFLILEYCIILNEILNN
jgi:hypothetical protein